MCPYLRLGKPLSAFMIHDVNIHFWAIVFGLYYFIYILQWLIYKCSLVWKTVMHFNFLTYFRKQLKNSGSSKFKIFPANHLLDTFLNCLLSFIIVIVRVLWECFEFVITNEVSEVSLIVAIFCVFVLDQNCVCNLSK